MLKIGKRYINLERVQEVTYYGSGDQTTAHVYFNSNSEDMLALHGMEAEALVAYLDLEATDVVALLNHQWKMEELEDMDRYSNGRVHRTVSVDEFNELLTAAVADGTALPDEVRG